MDLFKKFYIFTGKGGVGKTTLAISFCEYLKSCNKKYLYIYFESNKIEVTYKEHSFIHTFLKQNNINALSLNLVDCAKGYIAKKLKSETIASWIIKTPFFSSLINMIPGFSYVIYLGQILEYLVDDPNLIVVLDSPSSGHALTMLESTKNFNDIFQGGVIYEDTKLMLDTMKNPSFTKINILTLPTQLAINESIELQNKIKELEDYETGIFCNNVLSYSSETPNLPESLLHKIENENLAIESAKNELNGLIPYSLQEDMQGIIKDLVPSLEILV